MSSVTREEAIRSSEPFQSYEEFNASSMVDLLGRSKQSGGKINLTRVQQILATMEKNMEISSRPGARNSKIYRRRGNFRLLTRKWIQWRPEENHTPDYC